MVAPPYVGWVKVHFTCTSQSEAIPLPSQLRPWFSLLTFVTKPAKKLMPPDLPGSRAFRFFSLWEKHDNHKTQGELAVLQEANVVGMTTTGVAMHQSLVEALGATVVVVEEAAEVCASPMLRET